MTSIKLEPTDDGSQATGPSLRLHSTYSQTETSSHGRPLLDPWMPAAGAAAPVAVAAGASGSGSAATSVPGGENVPLEPFTARIPVSASTRREGFLKLQDSFARDAGMEADLFPGGPPVSVDVRVDCGCAGAGGRPADGGNDGPSPGPDAYITATLTAVRVRRPAHRAAVETEEAVPAGARAMADSLDATCDPAVATGAAGETAAGGAGAAATDSAAASAGGGAVSLGPSDAGVRTQIVSYRMMGVLGWMEKNGVAEGSTVVLRFIPPQGFTLSVAQVPEGPLRAELQGPDGDGTGAGTSDQGAGAAVRQGLLEAHASPPELSPGSPLQREGERPGASPPFTVKLEESQLSLSLSEGREAPRPPSPALLPLPESQGSPPPPSPGILPLLADKVPPPVTHPTAPPLPESQGPPPPLPESLLRAPVGRHKAPTGSHPSAPISESELDVLCRGALLTALHAMYAALAADGSYSSCAVAGRQHAQPGQPLPSASTQPRRCPGQQDQTVHRQHEAPAVSRGGEQASPEDQSTQPLEGVPCPTPADQGVQARRPPSALNADAGTSGGSDAHGSDTHPAASTPATGHVDPGTVDPGAAVIAARSGATDPGVSATVPQSRSFLVRYCHPGYLRLPAEAQGALLGHLLALDTHAHEVQPATKAAAGVSPGTGTVASDAAVPTTDVRGTGDGGRPFYTVADDGTLYEEIPLDLWVEEPSDGLPPGEFPLRPPPPCAVHRRGGQRVGTGDQGAAAGGSRSRDGLARGCRKPLLQLCVGARLVRDRPAGSPSRLPPQQEGRRPGLGTPERQEPCGPPDQQEKNQPFLPHQPPLKQCKMKHAAAAEMAIYGVSRIAREWGVRSGCYLRLERQPDGRLILSRPSAPAPAAPPPHSALNPSQQCRHQGTPHQHHPQEQKQQQEWLGPAAPAVQLKPQARAEAAAVLLCRRKGPRLQLPGEAVSRFLLAQASLVADSGVPQPLECLWAAVAAGDGSAAALGGGEGPLPQVVGPSAAGQGGAPGKRPHRGGGGGGGKEGGGGETGLVRLSGVRICLPRNQRYFMLEGLKPLLNSWRVSEGSVVRLRPLGCPAGSGRGGNAGGGLVGGGMGPGGGDTAVAADGSTAPSTTTQLLLEPVAPPPFAAAAAAAAEAALPDKKMRKGRPSEARADSPNPHVEGQDVAPAADAAAASPGGGHAVALDAAVTDVASPETAPAVHQEDAEGATAGPLSSPGAVLAAEALRALKRSCRGAARGAKRRAGRGDSGGAKRARVVSTDDSTPEAPLGGDPLDLEEDPAPQEHSS